MAEGKTKVLIKTWMWTYEEYWQSDDEEEYDDEEGEVGPDDFIIDLFGWDKKKIKKYKSEVRRDSRYQKQQPSDKKFYHNDEYLDLIKEFIYCYTELCSWYCIDFKKEKKWNGADAWYDIDIITILYLLKIMHDYNNDKVWYNKWILVRWFAFDKNFLKYSTNKLWNNDAIWKSIKNQRLPNDYIKFFETWDIKYLEKNSFLKYKKRIDINKLLNFLLHFLGCVDGYLLDMDIDPDARPKKIEKDIAELFKWWFENFVDKLDIEEQKKEYIRKWQVIRTVPKFEVIMKKDFKENDRGWYTGALYYLCKKYPKQLTEALLGMVCDIREDFDTFI